jgi:hypothetical protein
MDVSDKDVMMTESAASDDRADIADGVVEACSLPQSNSESVNVISDVECDTIDKATSYMPLAVADDILKISHISPSDISDDVGRSYDSIDYDSMNVSELRHRCRVLNLAYSGRKKIDLIEILKKNKVTFNYVDAHAELSALKVVELRARCQKLGLKDYSSLRKIELVKLLGDHNLIMSQEAFNN